MNIESHTVKNILIFAREASAWCDKLWNACEPRSSLRTLEFSPDFFGTNHYHTVNSILYARRDEMERRGMEPANDLSAGKILIYEPDSNIVDGSSEIETNGYLDVNDCPPWDTWIGYIILGDCRYVISWVPYYLVSLINAGAKVNCVDCFYWASESAEPWAIELENS